MIEILVATAIFSLGMSSLSLMFMTSMHGTIEARNQTMASMQARSLADLILLNPASLGHYINPLQDNVDTCISSEGCSGPAWAASNLARWQFELEQSLAEAIGLVCRDSSPDDGHAGDPACESDGQTVVKVFWTESRHLEDEDGGLRRVSFPVSN